MRRAVAEQETPVGASTLPEFGPVDRTPPPAREPLSGPVLGRPPRGPARSNLRPSRDLGAVHRRGRGPRRPTPVPRTSARRAASRMLKLRDNPPMTLPGAGPLADEPAPWRVAYAKPRQEKALAWDLGRRGIPYFLPLVLRETSSGGRRRRNLYPLFASYLFYAGDEATRLAALKTERIVTHVDIAPGEQDRFRREIAALELGLRTAPDRFELHPRLVPGARVRVVGGPMKGLEGNVVNADHRSKLFLGVTALGSGATVEIHPDLVEPVAGAADWRPGTIEYQVAEGHFVATTTPRQHAQPTPGNGD